MTEIEIIDVVTKYLHEEQLGTWVHLYDIDRSEKLGLDKAEDIVRISNGLKSEKICDIDTSKGRGAPQN